ncbi:UDP-N-acetylmuramate dehydrogenase [Gilvimarinus sp. SDUM040013]|uniref:UDP-N-acetylenolpyruvoylglucosamine reductase n=1 Tax=Gilvimarinus gilvus TaxID=3058038 RepID=A0ABU4S136_9GAMM|nr:UDP-N-acetylmuramate dehydrogenase [Gilvimarinus sp. SDUM040013]MDO3387146.1 UDP-N-acetylmuramate dehydrogenase [Gilvimarinus sp. SDUM040013]MDX6850889.1 UDP-N-acetylmuramate dehydrogenase [Gilvimarinus sp. SDUM040013]
MPLFLPEFNLARVNTLASPVNAKAYVAVQNMTELVEAIKYASEHDWPILPLGGGSNIVLTNDFPGLVIHLKLQGVQLEAESEQAAWVRVQAGENWHDFVVHSLLMGWYGLENLSLIPGSAGAAPIQNIGAYGVELESVFEELTALDIGSCLPVTFTRESCGFGYRDSVFKHRLRDRYIITSVLLKLSKLPRLTLQYPALRDRVESLPAEQVTPERVSALVCSIRSEKLPDPDDIPNVGSFFKNPVVGSEQFAQLQRQWSDIVGYPQPNGRIKLAAAWLIDRAGLKGMVMGAVAVHDKQALVLTNPGRAVASEIIALATKVQNTVLEQFGVKLEIEPRVY